MGTLIQDLRYAVRMLARAPGFTAVAVLTLALGIGANTAIFSVAYGILLKPLPYPDSSRLVQLSLGNSKLGTIAYMRTQDFRETAAQSDVFEQLAGYTEGGSTIHGVGGPESVQTSFVSGIFFTALGARPLLGRPILPADAEPGHDQVAVVSYDLWQRRYGGDPGIIGKSIALTVMDESGSSEDNSLKTLPYTVIGVMPSRFPFPNHGDLLLPQASWERQFQVIAIARLKPGVSISEANTELHTIAVRIAAQTPAGHKNFDLSVGPLRDRMSEGYSTELLVLLGAVAFILLLACVNIGGLLLSRSWIRQKEVAIRETFGATRWRLIRQFLSESILLGLLGAFPGLLLGFWGINLLKSLAPPYSPRLDEISIDWLVLTYALGISVLAGILFGLAPALRLTRGELGQSLKESSLGSLTIIRSHGPARVKNLLVAGEIALVFVLVVGSALALRSFSNLMSVKLGFQPAHVLNMYVGFSPAMRANPQRFKLAVDEVLQRTRALPGVEDSAFSEWLPIGGSSTIENLQIAGSAYSGPVTCQVATPGYFSTLGIPLLAGRTFNDGDFRASAPASNLSGNRPPSSNSTTHSQKHSSSPAPPENEKQKGPPLVAIVNESFAKDFFDGRALGKHFQAQCFGTSDLVQIVGVVGDMRDVRRQLPPTPEFYTPVAQAEGPVASVLFVRTAANPMAMAKAVREQIWAVDNNAPVEDLKTMDAVISESVAEPRFETVLLGAFGGLGLALAIVGVYGLISYATIQRTHEIGVRMALGAGRGDVMRMILGEGMFLAFVGIVIGVGGALALTRFLRSMLFEVKPTDPATFIGVAILLTLVALAACYIPARRAMKVDPMAALRYE